MKTNHFIRLNAIVLIASIWSAYCYAGNEYGEPLRRLKEGNERFRTNQMTHNHQDIETVKSLSTGQAPFAIVVSCSDSRVAPEIIFDQGLGDIFTVRTAGNVMGDYEEGSIEYAVGHLYANLIVVLGHTSCGAINTYLDTCQSSDSENVSPHSTDELGHIACILEKLGNEKEMQAIFEKEGDLKKMAVKANVTHGVEQLKTSTPILSKLYQEKKLNIIGAIYHIESGDVEFLEP